VTDNNCVSSSTLETLVKLVAELQRKIEYITETQNEILNALNQCEVKPVQKTEVIDVVTLLSLPDHLRKTALVINKVQMATANDVAKKTKRTRALESAYLNQMVRMKFLTKVKKGHNVYFCVRGYDEWAKL
jgi:ArsR family transcriptional regulator, lead/cadmium/zinc/bismuth-responsive transcriptional repressor